MSESRCADYGGDEFVCTQDVQLLRERLDGHPVDVGVSQRIDGTEEEKRQIREVLKKMTDYFLDEVLAMPAYEQARSLWYVDNRECHAIGTRL